MVPYLLAVWNRSGSVAFSNPQQAGELGWGKLAAVRNEGHIESVDAVSLDAWHESVGSPPIRLIKIDAEGSEPFILEGANSVISCTRPYLIIELNDELLREVGRTREIVAHTLRDEGYRIFPLGLKSLDESRDFIDPLSFEILCVPSDLLEEATSMLSDLRTKH
jgi:hypothetical protein